MYDAEVVVERTMQNYNAVTEELPGKRKSMKRLFALLGLFIAAFILAACASAAEPTAVPEIVLPEEPAATLPPTPTLASAEAAVAVEGEMAVGMTAEGAFYKGNPAAPVKMIDYSNFL